MLKLVRIPKRPIKSIRLSEQPGDRSVHLSGQETGQALIEMAIILPLILLILAGVFDFGRVLHAYTVVENATREAAFAGAAEPLSEANLRNLIDAELLRGGVTTGTATSTVSYQSKGSPSAQTITVNLAYDFPLIMRLLPISSVTVRAQAETVVFW